MSNSIELQKKYEFNVYPKREINLVKGDNSYVWDDQGRKYIDCVAGHGVANIGHSNEKIAEALAAQARTLITCSGIFYNDVRAKLLQKLIDFVPDGLNRAFFCNSGAETIEAAIKFARFTTQKTDFITAMNGFHGRTFGAMTATFKKEYRDVYEPLVPGFHYVPYNQFEKLADVVDDQTAAIILEVVQGEGGVRIGSKEYFQKVRNLCDEKNILLIVDEVQTSFCRTGHRFAIEHVDVIPDILCVAKALAGGFPMGAVICGDHIEAPVGKHGTTYGGNPLACSAAIASIDFMVEEKLEQQAEKKGDVFLKMLQEIKSSKIREIRQLGLMVGIELKEKVQSYLQQLMELGILALPAGPTVLRFLPPLTIDLDDLEKVANSVKEVLEQ